MPPITRNAIGMMDTNEPNPEAAMRKTPAPSHTAKSGELTGKMSILNEMGITRARAAKTSVRWNSFVAKATSE